MSPDEVFIDGGVDVRASLLERTRGQVDPFQGERNRMPKVAPGVFRTDGESMPDKASDLISGRAGPQGGEV